MRPDRLYLEDIVSAATAIAAFVGDSAAEAFAADDLTRSAVLFKLVVIGEAASKVSAELRALYADVAWREMIAFRNFAVHAYFGVDSNIVWTTAIDDLPPVLARVAAILATLPAA